MLFLEACRAFWQVSEGSGFREFVPVKDDNPEDAALEIRRQAGLDRVQPVRNVTRLAERLGVGVISQLAEPGFTGGHEGISMPTLENNRPLIATIGVRRGDRHRFNLAHELGHIIFDNDRQGPIRSTRSPEEARAHQFAGALLLPADVARKEISESLQLHGYLRIKADYGISVAATVRRGKELGLISDLRYRSLNIQLSSAGWRADEPVEVPFEEPRLFSQALGVVYGNRMKAAQVLGIPTELLERWAPSGESHKTSVGSLSNVIAFPKQTD